MSNNDWDEVVDVVVVGSGGAGAIAAITAHDAGATVLLLEKQPDPGGLTIISAGGVRMAEDTEAAFAYLQATCGGRTPDAVLRALAEGMASLPRWMAAWAATCGATLSVTPAVGNYPLPGFDRLGYASITAVPGLDAAPHAASVLTDGGRLFAVLEANLRARSIPIRLATPVRRLVLAPGGGVAGVVADPADGARRIRTRRGVVLACGGFEANATLQSDFIEARPILNPAFHGNTGDGIAMAQQAGAALWHMWHLHGGYGLRHPDPAYPYAFFVKALPMWTPGREADLPPMAWILLDRDGRRFMDEYPPYLSDTGIRPLDALDPRRQATPRIPAILVFDEAGRRLYPMGRSVTNGRAPAHAWSADNLREVDLGILHRAATLDALAEQAGLSAAAVARSIAAWNASCAAGADAEFGRRPETMRPIATPPFYWAEAWPLVINTQGGPVHDAAQRVLDPYGDPIPGLFAAGELGSIFGHLYLAGGNLAECVVGGRLAGLGAAGHAGT